jgi:hypothetical protein
LENRGISGGKKEMNQVGRVIGMKMGQKNLPDSIVANAYARKLPECSRSRIKQNRPRTGVKHQGWRSAVRQGNPCSGSNDNEVHGRNSHQVLGPEGKRPLQLKQELKKKLVAGVSG